MYLSIAASNGVLMGILNRLFGYRWSVYVVRNGNELLYALHEHCPVPLTGYLLGYFKGRNEPVSPWSLHLNFNRTHEAFQLDSSYFLGSGDIQTSKLIGKIEEFDPKWRNRRGKEPVFMEMATKKVIPLSSIETPVTTESFQAMIDNVGKSEELDFYSIMDGVFGRKK